MLEKNIQTIALYGGSFDPPHIGHEAIINALLQLYYIDKVVVMPTYLNPFKESSFAPANLRLAWLKKMFFFETDVVVDDYEVTQNKKVPAIESVKYLLQNHEKVYLVIGADNLEKLHKWHKYDELKNLVTFIVASRQDIAIPANFIKIKIDEEISSSELRESMDTTKIPTRIKTEIIQYYKEKN